MRYPRPSIRTVMRGSLPVILIVPLSVAMYTMTPSNPARPSSPAATQRWETPDHPEPGLERAEIAVACGRWPRGTNSAWRAPGGRGSVRAGMGVSAPGGDAGSIRASPFRFLSPGRNTGSDGASPSRSIALRRNTGSDGASPSRIGSSVAASAGFAEAERGNVSSRSASTPASSGRCAGFLSKHEESNSTAASLIPCRKSSSTHRRPVGAGVVRSPVKS